MPATINPIKKQIVKQSLLNGNSARQALKNANYTDASVSHSTGMAVVKCSMNEIQKELDKEALVEKAFNKLNECLDSDKKSDIVAAAQNILRFTLGDKLKTEDISKEKRQRIDDIINRLTLSTEN